MNYYALQSIIAASKSPIPMAKPSLSFAIAGKPDFQYIEPDFSKEAFKIEKPAIILVSAAGATGKSALAKVLSYQMSLPLLDLSQHKPVGDNTLTGLVADSFNTGDLSTVFGALQKGTYGIVIDGIDEGRAKVTEKAFEAFLDDIAERCKGATTTCFVLLGRTNILEDCWLYLTEKGISTGLISIQPFDLPRAKQYIDVLSGGMKSRFNAQYQVARDLILNLLSDAFNGTGDENNHEFLPFIGYPPVLDAIATLLAEERDYNQLRNSLTDHRTDNVEIDLLSKISEYILRREKEKKVYPNILSPLIKDMPLERQKSLAANAYNVKEQCQRLVSFCLNRNMKMDTIVEKALNDKYEEQLGQFLPEHPFITNRCFRNTVFESFALATLIASNDPQCVSLVLEYSDSHKHSYHLVYLLNHLAPRMPLLVEYLRIVLGSAYEFHSSGTTVDVHVDSLNVEEEANSTSNNIEAEIDIKMANDSSKQIQFSLFFEVKHGKQIYLGNSLSSTYIWLPFEVTLSAPEEIQLTAPVYIEAKSITLSANGLIVRNPPKSAGDENVELVTETVNSRLLNIKRYGAGLLFIVPKKNGLTHPVFEYAIEAGILPIDKESNEKYLRLKRILVEFRSHSRGQLARFKVKIENPRILRNEIGRAVLNKLLDDKILTLKNVHYFLDMDRLGAILGVSWQDLRTNKISPKLMTYLKEIRPR